MNRAKIVNEIGLRLRKIRKSLNYTQEKMGSFLGVARPSYDRYERGEVFPGPIALTVLSNTFKVSLDWLIANKGSMIYSEKVEPEENVQQPEEKAQPQEKTAADVVTADVKELLAHMERIPLLRYEILTMFHKFKLKNKELVESAMKDTDTDTDTDADVPFSGK
ncbi:MAG: helix-turn-helix domain-containing protein [Candidatus Aminicenantes bacterium]|nr:helix-turn-helix domain-containing protein [Candidatus Aminicenantes bacterium]NIM77754.1 helix-turn-helix domain-containing protein [Candidatus Aminicenantes bacterium]NIN17067.1 helix-turn-helix domain-containing protein [Candidatus Aminicenantes bacterium]NIN40960.1 helix-turn-helix domain-containing protein [Candidatus Aminicenantes bacterium]NIN83765.1 helix-turn-helix domain-containing protein [Candidatus Aminicenantes bacterium]